MILWFQKRVFLLQRIALLMALLGYDASTRGLLVNSLSPLPQPSSSWQSKSSTTTTTTRLGSAPKGALSDIVIPNIFGADLNVQSEEDERVWVPQTDCLDFRPLCFCTSQGYYVNLLRFKGGGVLGCHFHPSPVHALTLRGSWGYKEHDWHATVGAYVFEPPGETHTLVVDDDCNEMIALFHVTGALIYKDPVTGQVTGYDDVFTKLEKARAWYKQCGLGEEYAEQFVR